MFRQRAAPAGALPVRGETTVVSQVSPKWKAIASGESQDRQVVSPLTGGGRVDGGLEIHLQPGENPAEGLAFFAADAVPEFGAQHFVDARDVLRE